MGLLRDDLLRPDAYPEPRPTTIELRETHVSWVFLAGDHVYKVKKPVDLGFLDFSTPELRSAACDAELTLNRRLAADVYLDVVSVTGDGSHHRIGGPGLAVEHAVHMRRLPDAHRADVLLGRGVLDYDTVDRIAITLARFHAACRVDAETARFGAVEAIAVNVTENFRQTRTTRERFVSASEASEIEERQLAMLRDRADLFETRVAQGRIRDGHGDLRLEHVYVDDDAVRIIDCIEFADRFRFADVACDLAFLAMDLEHHRRVDLAERLLASYAREADDFDLYSVIDFYESYRAYVRAKIASIVATSDGIDEHVRARASAEARRHFLLALATQRASALGPVLVAVGGIVASGKSTMASWISGRLGAPVVEADRTRKAMLGVAPTTRAGTGAWSGAYDRGFTEKVYAELARRARVVLASGRPVIVDASFRSAAMRAAAREVARSAGVPFVFVECSAPEDVCRRRLAERDGRADVVSDARASLYDHFVREWQPVVELDPSEHVRVDTARELARTHADILVRIATWPRGLSG